MRKVAALVVVCFIVMCSLSACSKETYDDAYEDGYNDGYSDAEFEMEDRLQDWYDFGYDEGQMDGHLLEEEAIEYVREHCDFHPEEAMEVIEAYHDNKPFWGDDSPPSHEEYLEAIESLYLFYEYFYCAMYE